MPNIKTKETRPRTKMELYLFNRHIVYRTLADAAGFSDHRKLWNIALGVSPTNSEKDAIIKGLHRLGFKCLPGDLW